MLKGRQPSRYLQCFFNDKQLFDLSDYPKDCEFMIFQTKFRVHSKNQDETAFEPIIGVVGLRSEMYSIKPESNLKAGSQY